MLPNVGESSAMPLQTHRLPASSVSCITSKILYPLWKTFIWIN